MHRDDEPSLQTIRITPDSNIERIYSDNVDNAEAPLNLVDYDSYIYGDAEATEEDTLETMTVYDPDSERYEDIVVSSEAEVVNCYSYSRKTGKQISQLALGDVSKALTNNNQFIWLGLYEPSLQTIAEVQNAFDLHELAIEDAFSDNQRAKVEAYNNDTVFLVVRTAKLEDN